MVGSNIVVGPSREGGQAVVEVLLLTATSQWQLQEFERHGAFRTKCSCQDLEGN